MIKEYDEKGRLSSIKENGKYTFKFNYVEENGKIYVERWKMVEKYEYKENEEV